jgi:hypothetical protein
MKNNMFRLISIQCFLFVANVFCGSVIYLSEPVTVSNFVGSGFYGYMDGLGEKTMFQPNFDPSDLERSLLCMTIKSDGTIFLVDGSGGQGRLRKIIQDGTVTTVADFTKIPYIGSMADSGNGYLFIFNSSRDSIFKLVEPNISAQVYKNGMQSPTAKVLGGFGRSMCVDSYGNIYLTSYSENRIYRITTDGLCEFYAGSGNQGLVDGNGLFCSFFRPSHIVCDQFDNIYVNDSGNQCIRKIDKSRNVTLFAGKNSSGSDFDGDKNVALIGKIKGLACDKFGNLYFSSGNSVRVITTSGFVKTVAGNYSNVGYNNGTSEEALFNNPKDLVCFGSSVFVYDNYRIRKITIGQNSIKKPVDNISIKLSAGITINGIVGKKYSIESSSNGGKQWVGLTELDLTKSPYTWYDENSVGTNNLYRVFESP